MDANLIICTSLEALLERATNIKNRCLDEAAYSAFSSVILKESQAAPIALRLLITKLQSYNEWEATQTLSLLEHCMENAGPNFQSEVGKFKFLNELIKLVSAKHRGDQTPYAVRNRIIQILYSWSAKYPSEFKIKEACDMLKKQGVTLDDVLPISISRSPVCNPKSESKVTAENARKEKLLQKLIQSGQPHDLRAANLLIQTMVKEEEDKEVLNELKNTLDLKLITNNVKLLSEMLSTYTSNSSQEEAEIITQLYESCDSMKDSLADMIMSHCKSSNAYAELLSLNDYLNDTMAHYRDVFYTKSDNENEDIPSLLDLGSPSHSQNNSSLTDATIVKVTNKTPSNIDALEDVFNLPLDPLESSSSDNIASSVTSVGETNSNLNRGNNPTATTREVSKHNSDTLFDDLDALGKSMLNMKMPSSVLKTESSSKATLNELTSKRRSEDVSDLLICMDDKEYEKSNHNVQSKISGNVSEYSDSLLKTANAETPTSDDDILLLDSVISAPNTPKRKIVKPLSDVQVSLVNVIPGNDEKISVLSDNNDVKIELQKAANKPREDVTVYLLFVTNKKEHAISEFLFQPVVPKDCRLKLQAATRTDLPPYNPYVPNVIVQVILIASSSQEFIPLTFVISYKIEGETFTEMGQINVLPL